MVFYAINKPKLGELFSKSRAVNVLSGARLFLFGAVFAINSSLHSYLIVSYAKEDGASLDVGFYYMCLIGTLLSGWIYQSAGFIACLWVSAEFITLAALVSIKLPYLRRG